MARRDCFTSPFRRKASRSSTMVENDPTSDNTHGRGSKDDVELAPVVTTDEGTVIDPIFGEVRDGGPDYRTMGWKRTSAVMMKTQIGIGALSIPTAFNDLGLIPGIFVLLLVAAITTWSGWMVGWIKKKYPQVYGIEHIGKLMLGLFGREVLHATFQLYYIFVTGSAVVSVATALSALAGHKACDWVFILIATIVAFIFSCLRTLSKVSWLAWIGVACILTSLFMLTIAVAAGSRPAAAPQTGPWSSDYALWGHSRSFRETMRAISQIVFAFSGTAAYFPIAAEMKDLKDYNKAMYLCQAVVTTIYLIVGVVVYIFCGSFVASPALASAGPHIKWWCYLVALPALLVTSLIVCHLPSKTLFMRVLRGSPHLNSNSFTHWSLWLGCNAVVVTIAYVIASGIPAFIGLVSLIGALLGTAICITPFGMMWLYENWYLRQPSNRSRWWTLKSVWAILVVTFGLFVMIAGSISAIHYITELYRKQNSVAWACSGTLDT